MTVLTSVQNGASNADIRATLNSFFSRIEAREGGTMPVLTKILNGSSNADIRQTINAALVRLTALEATATATPTPTPTPTLTALTLAASSIVENSASGTVVGGILGRTSGSTLSLTSDAGGRFAISGSNLIAGLTSTDYETATSHSITVRETLAGATGSPRDTAFTIAVSNVFEKPNLSSLSLSSTALTVGTASSGSITGATVGSTITATGLPTGFTISGAARTWSYDGSGSAGSSTIALVETLGDSANSPRESDVVLTRAAAGAGGSAITFDRRVTKSGNVLTFTARRTGDVSAARSATATLAGSSLYPLAALASDVTGGFASIPFTFAAGAATAQVQVTAPLGQPE